MRIPRGVARITSCRFGECSLASGTGWACPAGIVGLDGERWRLRYAWESLTDVMNFCEPLTCARVGFMLIPQSSVWVSYCAAMIFASRPTGLACARRERVFGRRTFAFTSHMTTQHGRLGVLQIIDKCAHGTSCEPTRHCLGSFCLVEHSVSRPTTRVEMGPSHVVYR